MMCSRRRFRCRRNRKSRQKLAHLSTAALINRRDNNYSAPMRAGGL